MGLYRRGSVTYSGRIWELCRNCEPGQTDFFYYPATRQLYIDRSDFIENGFVDICTDERYQVERICADNLWLYDLDDVDDEVAEYRFKIKLRRITEDRP